MPRKPAQPNQFVLRQVVGVAKSATGDKAIVRMSSESGQSLDLVAPGALQDLLLGALIQASQVAYDQRRTLGLKDEMPMSVPIPMLSWRFGFDRDGTQLRLQALTPQGTIELVIPAAKAAEFVASAADMADSLAGRQHSGVN